MEGDMDTKQELLSRLRQIVSEHLGVEEREITENSTWTELRADSLDRLQISFALEGALNIHIPHSIGERLNTVGETLDHLWTLKLARTERLPCDKTGVMVRSITGTNEEQ